MTNVLIADKQPEVRLALTLLLLDLGMQVTGEAADWPSTLKSAADTQPDMVIVDWELILADDLHDLRATCLGPVIIVLIGSLNSRQQAAISVGADSYVSKYDPPDRLAERLKAAVSNHHPS